MSLRKSFLANLFATLKLAPGSWKTGQSKPVIRLVISSAFILVLAGCSGWLENLWAGAISQLTPQTPVEATPTNSPTETPTFEPLPTSSGPLPLHVWVPPQFDPKSNSAAGELLQARLDAFMQEHPEVRVDVRVKSPSGPGGLLEALTTTSAAAPEAMPGLIALSRADLEAAAIKGLIFPLDELSDALDDKDWYPFARQLASLQESVFGLPFAGDALLLLYRPGEIGSQPPLTWEDVLGRGSPLLFLAGDPQGLVTLTLYRSAGGSVQDSQGRPSLTPEILAAVFDLYQKGSRNGIFPASLAQYQSTGQAWQAFREGQADWVITWSSNYLSELPPDTSAALLPPLDTDSLTIANGWAWALSDPDPARRAISITLAEYLTESDYLGAWSAAAGYLPTRPSALEIWPNESLQPLIDQLILSAQVRPANELMASLGPVLQEATLAVIKDLVAPIQAAQSASQKLEAP